MLANFFFGQKAPALFDVSHPRVGQAQHLANHNKASYILVPNIIGGIDIVKCDRVGLDDQTDAVAIAVVTPNRDLMIPKRKPKLKWLV